MTKPRTRLIAAGAISALCLSPLAACGSGGGTGSDKPGSSANSSEHEAKPLTQEDFAQRVSDAVTQQGSGHLTMDMGAQGEGEGDFAFEDGKASGDMTIKAGGQEMKMLFVDGKYYMQGGGIAPAGKWAKIDKSTPMIGQMLDQMGNMTPDKQIELMGRATRKFEHTGSDKIDGIDVEEYQLTLDTKAVLTEMGMGNVPATGMPKQISYTMYVDHEDLARRMEMDLQGQAFTINWSDYGKDVDIEAPPAGDIVDFKMPSAPSSPAA